jgi:hypothetical protein
MAAGDVEKVERIRLAAARTILPVINMAKQIASCFPPEDVEAKVTADWLLKKGEIYFPELVQVVNKYGEKGRAWVERQAEEVRKFLTGKIVFHPQKLRFVSVEELKAEIAKAKAVQQGRSEHDHR